MPYSLEDDLAAAADAGFTAVEIWGEKLAVYREGHSPGQLRLLLAQRELTPAAICGRFLRWEEGSPDSRQEVLQMAEWAAEIGCSYLTYALSSSSRRTPPNARSRAIDALARCTEVASRLGVKMALEPLGRDPVVPGPTEALDLIRTVGHPDLGLVLDLYHAYLSGIGAEEIRAIPRDELYLVHVADAEDLPREKLDYRRRLYPTQGVIPLRQMLGALQETGYDSYLSVEVFREEYWRCPPGEIARAAKCYLDSLIC